MKLYSMNYFFNRFYLSIFFIAGFMPIVIAQKINAEPPNNQSTTKKDWLVSPINQKAQVIEEGNQITLNNGLVKRVFKT